MRETSTPRLAAERLAEAAGWSVEGRTLVAYGHTWVQDSWWRTLGYVVDLMMRNNGLGMTAREVWELCRFDARRVLDKGLVYFHVPDHGWPSQAIAQMLNASDAVQDGGVERARVS